MSVHLSTLEKPFIVSYEVTSQCSLDCFFCCAQLSKYRREDLPTEAALQVISKIADAGVYSIFLTGGEPLQRSDLPLLIEECLARGMNVSLSTNGVEASRTTAELIAATGLEEVQVSIHAPDETHDRLVGVSGALDRGLDGLRNLVDAGLRVTVASVATRQNYWQLPRLAELVAGMGARYFRVLRLMPHSDDLLQQLVPHDGMKTIVKQLMDLEKRMEDFIVSVHASPGFQDERYHNPDEYGIVHPLCHTCTAGKTSMAILSNGDCTPCVELKSPEFVCGNIITSPLAEIWASEPMSLLRSATPDNYLDRCGQCEYRWTCYSARCAAFSLEGDVLGDDLSCYLLGPHAMPAEAR